MFIKSSLRPIAGKVSIFVSAALTFGLIGSSVPASAVPVSGSITYPTAGSTQVWLERVREIVFKSGLAKFKKERIGLMFLRTELLRQM